MAISLILSSEKIALMSSKEHESTKLALLLYTVMRTEKIGEQNSEKRAISRILNLKKSSRELRRAVLMRELKTYSSSSASSLVLSFTTVLSSPPLTLQNAAIPCIPGRQSVIETHTHAHTHTKGKQDT